MDGFRILSSCMTSAKLLNPFDAHWGLKVVPTTLGRHEDLDEYL